MEDRARWFRNNGELALSQRIEQRTRFDMEMLKEFGSVHGIENYSRHLSGDCPESLLSRCLITSSADRPREIISWS